MPWWDWMLQMTTCPPSLCHWSVWSYFCPEATTSIILAVLISIGTMVSSIIKHSLMATLLVTSSAGTVDNKVTTGASPCLNLCWRRGSQCWYWHYNGLGDTYTEAKCDGIFDSCANSCNSQGMKLAAGNLSDTEAQVPKTSEDAAKKSPDAVLLP